MKAWDQFCSQPEGVFISTGKGTILAGFGTRTEHANPIEGSWYLPDFFLQNSSPFILFEQTKDIPIQELVCEPLELAWSEPDFTHFEQSFAQKGKLRKWVPYVSFPCQGAISVRELLAHGMRYLKLHPRSTLYGFWNGSQGMVGITPEKLFSIEGETLATMAVAGTASRERYYLLAKDKKLVDEHEIVVEAIEKDLSPFGKFIRFPREVRTFGPLSHLVTEIEVSLSSHVQFEKIVRALHPTPALGAYPKLEGEKWLAAYESSSPRGRYGAPFGYIDKERALCVVAIRNLQWRKDQGEIICGCGVTELSELKAEKEEVYLKWRAVKEALGLV